MVLVLFAMNEENQHPIKSNNSGSSSSSSSGFLSVASSTSFFDFHDAMQDHYDVEATDLEAGRGSSGGTNENQNDGARQVSFNSQVAVYDTVGNLHYYRFGSSDHDDDNPHQDRERIVNETTNVVHTTSYIGMGSYWDLNDFSRCGSPTPDGEDTSVSFSNDDSFQLDDLLAMEHVIPGDLEDQKLPRDIESTSVRSMCIDDTDSGSSSSLGPRGLFPDVSSSDKKKNDDEDDADSSILDQRRGEEPTGLWLSGLCCLAMIGPKVYSFFGGGSDSNGVVDEGDAAGGFIPTGGEGLGGGGGGAGAPSATAVAAGGGGGGVSGGGSSAAPVVRWVSILNAASKLPG